MNILKLKVNFPLSLDVSDDENLIMCRSTTKKLQTPRRIFINKMCSTFT